MMLASDVTVRFGERVALSIRRLEVERGEAIGVRGANGCGKTTLLRVLAGFLAPTSGRTDVPRPGRTVLLHQRPHLFIGTAHDNVEFALVAQRVPRRERAARVGEALDRLGATPFASRTAADLSGGERRRVAVARALVVRPELLRLDGHRVSPRSIAARPWFSSSRRSRISTRAAGDTVHRSICR